MTPDIGTSGTGTSGAGTIDPQRARQLLAVKLKSLVADVLGRDFAQSLGGITGTDDGAFAVASFGAGSVASGSAESGSVASGSAGSGPAKTVAVYLAEHQPISALGPALAVAERAGASELHVFATSGTTSGTGVAATTTGAIAAGTTATGTGTDAPAMLARRATYFDFPIVVWAVAASPAQPGPDSASPTRPAAVKVEGNLDRIEEPAPPRVPELVELLQTAEADVSVEHGVITGEAHGLEIARIVPAPTSDFGAGDFGANSFDTGDFAANHSAQNDSGDQSAQQWRIEVGVGAHDREAFGILHANEPVVESIKRVAKLVRSHRTPGAEPHPLNRMAAARWLRAMLLEQPELAGAKRLTAASPPVARIGVTDNAPAVCYGIDQFNHPLVVVSSVGIYLDLVPFAADARAFLDSSARLVLAIPQRDAHPLLNQQIGWLRPAAPNPTDSTPVDSAHAASDQATPVPPLTDSVRIVTLPNDWRVTR